MGIFGWDLPPGCTSGDIERAFGGGDPSPESEEIYEMLEAAEVDQTIIDKVCEIVDRLALKECPECVRRQNEAEAVFEAEMAKEFQNGRL